VAEVLLFHHALGLTDGCRSFADELRAEGHVVHLPDLYDGRTFTELDDGIAWARSIGFETISERGRRAAEALPCALVYAGFSLGVSPAQRLAQTRDGARGALFFYACFPPDEFGAWPRGVPVQVHAMEGDEWFDEDLPGARELVASASPDAVLYLYPGDRHLFADPSTSDYDADAAALLLRRVLAFLAALP
jgi:dienelactone hydrolase